MITAKNKPDSSFILHPSSLREGFTLIEMMVATALTLFVMTILSQAFVTSLDVFSGLKAIGDMEEGLRTAAMNLRADLSLSHFEGNRRLSDPGFWNDKPREGFFRIVAKASAAGTGNPSPGDTLQEGADQDGITSSRCDNRLHFYSRKRGDRRQDFFFASGPSGSALLTSSTTFFNQPGDARYQEGTVYGSQGCEIVYFLWQTSVIPGTSTQLYALCRGQYLTLADPLAASNTLTSATGYENFSYHMASGKVVFNSPEDLTTVTNRVFDPAGTYTGSAPPAGATVVLPNVLSFQVQRLGDSGTFLDDANNAFDTAGSAPSPALTRAVKITIRVWDNKTLQARQVTIIQDL